MTTSKKEFSAIDAAPNVLYAKLSSDRDNPFTFPLVCDTDGRLLVSSSAGTGGTTLITGSVSALITDGLNFVDVTQAANFSTGITSTTADTLKVSSIAHQYWPQTGYRSGITGDNKYYAAIQNDLGDFLISLGSLTSTAGSIQLEVNAGNASNGTPRVVIASNQPPLTVTGSTTVVGVVSVTGSTSITNVVTVTGSTSIINTVTVTGSTSVINTVATAPRMMTTGTATLANVTAVTISTTLLTTNTSRIGATIYNDSTSILYLKFGTTASTTSFTVKLLAEDYFELPQPIFTGHITGIWASTTGAARTTELT